MNFWRCFDALGSRSWFSKKNMLQFFLSNWRGLWERWKSRTNWNSWASLFNIPPKLMTQWSKESRFWSELIKGQWQIWDGKISWEDISQLSQLLTLFFKSFVLGLRCYESRQKMLHQFLYDWISISVWHRLYPWWWWRPLSVYARATAYIEAILYPPTCGYCTEGYRGILVSYTEALLVKHINYIVNYLESAIVYV